MKAIRRTKIRFEKHELKFVRVSGNVQYFCQICRTETKHFSISQMATLLCVSEKTIFRLVEIGQIHSFETPEGQLFICVASVTV